MTRAHLGRWKTRIGSAAPLMQRLLASGARVLDVPAKLAARARL